VLLRKAILDCIVAGEVDLAFRRWTRPTVRAGGTLRTSAGLLQIVGVEVVSIDGITEDDAHRAGVERHELLSLLNAKAEGQVYRVELGSIGPDPRVTLRDDDDLSDGDVRELIERLDRLDRASRRGPWTRQVLGVLATNPHVRAQDLADGLGLQKAMFKNDLRKLKALGLTVSHSPGYELSPRGRALLVALVREDDG